MLKKLLETGCFSRANAVGGFEGSGIYPLNEDKILKKCETSSVLSSTGSLDQGENAVPSIYNIYAEPGTQSEQVALASLTSCLPTAKQDPVSPKKSLELSILLALKRQEKIQITQKRKSSPKIC